jgi:hypothetical protein
MNSYLTTAYSEFRRYGSQRTLQDLPNPEQKPDYVAPPKYEPGEQLLEDVQSLVETGIILNKFNMKRPTTVESLQVFEPFIFDNFGMTMYNVKYSNIRIPEVIQAVALIFEWYTINYSRYTALLVIQKAKWYSCESKEIRKLFNEYCKNNLPDYQRVKLNY